MTKKHMKAIKKHLKNRHKRHHDDPSGIFVPAGLLTGMGIGFVNGNIPAGLFIGLGVGLAIMALIQLLGKK
jgi:hypothetical protein